MRATNATDPDSVLNTANYVLSCAGTPLPVAGVQYNAARRTATLTVHATEAGVYELSVLPQVASAAGIAMGQAFTTKFSGLLDATDRVQMDLATTRLHRGDQTVSFDVSVLNTSGGALQTPLLLYLQPVAGYGGVPLDDPFRWADGRWLVDITGALDGRTSLGPGESTRTWTVTVQNPDYQQVDFAFGIWSGWGDALPLGNTVAAAAALDVAVTDLLWQRRAVWLPAAIGRWLPTESMMRATAGRPESSTVPSRCRTQAVRTLAGVCAAQRMSATVPRGCRKTRHSSADCGSSSPCRRARRRWSSRSGSTSLGRLPANRMMRSKWRC